MTTAQALAAFMAQADTQGLDITGDLERFYRLSTARAWTKFHHAATKGKSWEEQ